MTRRAELQLRWADTDQYGHVNNVETVRLVEEARIRLLGLPEKRDQFPAGAPPILASLAAGTFTMVAGQRIEYLTELTYAGQSVVAEVWLSRIGSRSIAMDCRLTGAAGELVQSYAIARVSVVIMDSATHRPRALTESEIAELTEHRGEPLAFRE